MKRHSNEKVQSIAVSINMLRLKDIFDFHKKILIVGSNEFRRKTIANIISSNDFNEIFAYSMNTGYLLEVSKDFIKNSKKNIDNFFSHGNIIYHPNKKSFIIFDQSGSKYENEKIDRIECNNKEAYFIIGIPNDVPVDDSFDMIFTEKVADLDKRKKMYNQYFQHSGSYKIFDASMDLIIDVESEGFVIDRVGKIYYFR
jgi:hypothetical protein